jgi:hypothetical protein
MRTYVTFGQQHTHRINGHTLDCNCVALVDGDRERVFELFGPKFCFEYPEAEFDKAYMKYYPRGVIEI